VAEKDKNSIGKKGSDTVKNLRSRLMESYEGETGGDMTAPTKVKTTQPKIKQNNSLTEPLKAEKVSKSKKGSKTKKGLFARLFNRDIKEDVKVDPSLGAEKTQQAGEASAEPSTEASAEKKPTPTVEKTPSASLKKKEKIKKETVKDVGGFSLFRAFFSIKQIEKLALGTSYSEDHVLSSPKIPKAVMLSTIFINILTLAMPLVILQVYDRILPNQATETLAMLIIGLAGVMLLDTVMKLARSYMVAWSAAKYGYQASEEAVSRILNAPIKEVSSEAPSAFIDRLNALDAMKQYYGGQSRLMLLDLPFVLVFLGMIVLIGGWLAVVPVILFCFMGYATLKSGKKLREVLETRSEQDEKKYDFIIESLLGIQTIKSMAMEPQIQRRFERLMKGGVDNSYKTIYLANNAQTYSSLFANLTMVCMVTCGAYYVINGPLTIGVLAACTLLSGRIIQPLLKGLGLWTQMQTLSVSQGRINELFELPSTALKPKVMLKDCEGHLEFKNVSFAHKDGENIFKNFNFEAKPGEIIGLSGEDGSGKSTFTGLVLGEYTPIQGEVLLDGKSITGDWAYGISEWVAYAPQTATLFSGTLLENITMFRTGSAIDSARMAAELIGLEEDVNRLPQGYDTMLSAGITSELPQGLVQRIVIARALARQPKLFVFDEANSALDSRGDKLLIEGLSELKGEMTVLLISHRPSLLRLADHQYTFKNGVLVPTAQKAPPPPPGQGSGEQTAQQAMGGAA